MRKKAGGVLKKVKVDFSDWNIPSEIYEDALKVEKNGSTVSIELDLGKHFDQSAEKLVHECVEELLSSNQCYICLSKKGLSVHGILNSDRYTIPWEHVGLDIDTDNDTEVCRIKSAIDQWFADEVEICLGRKVTIK